MEIEELREICNLTLELTKLRQNECKHLCIENAAPEIFGRLLHEYKTSGPKFGPMQDGGIDLLRSFD